VAIRAGSQTRLPGLSELHFRMRLGHRRINLAARQRRGADCKYKWDINARCSDVSLSRTPGPRTVCRIPGPYQQPCAPAPGVSCRKGSLFIFQQNFCLFLQLCLVSPVLRSTTSIIRSFLLADGRTKTLSSSSLATLSA